MALANENLETVAFCGSVDPKKLARYFGEEHKFWYFWNRRYQIFPNFDEMLFDFEGLYSAKTKETAIEMASRFQSKRVIDPFCGIGSMSIALAELGRDVLASDISQSKLDMAVANAAASGLSTMIEFQVSDIEKLWREEAFDGSAVFLDPPWGGMGYTKVERFGWNDFPLSSFDIIAFLRTVKAQEIILTLPFNFDLDLMKLTKKDWSVEKHLIEGGNGFYSAKFLE